MSPIPEQPEPLACPFCGKAVTVRTMATNYAEIVCCAALSAMNRADAITLWNRRSPSVSEPVPTTELEIDNLINSFEIAIRNCDRLGIDTDSDRSRMAKERAILRNDIRRRLLPSLVSEPVPTPATDAMVSADDLAAVAAMLRGQLDRARQGRHGVMLSWEDAEGYALTIEAAARQLGGTLNVFVDGELVTVPPRCVTPCIMVGQLAATIEGDCRRVGLDERDFRPLDNAAFIPIVEGQRFASIPHAHNEYFSTRDPAPSLVSEPVTAIAPLPDGYDLAEHDADLAYWQAHVEGTRRDTLNPLEYPALDAEIVRIKWLRTALPTLASRASLRETAEPTLDELRESLTALAESLVGYGVHPSERQLARVIALRLRALATRGPESATAEPTPTRDELITALADIVAKGTDYGTQEGGFVAFYLLPTGPVHRAIPLLQQCGLTIRPGFDGRSAAAPRQEPAATEEIVCLRRFDAELGQTVFEPLPDAARQEPEEPTPDVFDLIQKHELAMDPQCNGGWVISRSVPTGGDDYEVEEIVRTREKFGVAIRMALDILRRETQGRWNRAARQEPETATPTLSEMIKPLRAECTARPRSEEG